MVNGDNLQMQTSCSPRIKKSNTTTSLQTQLILSTVKYSFMLLSYRSVTAKCHSSCAHAQFISTHVVSFTYALFISRQTRRPHRDSNTSVQISFPGILSLVPALCLSFYTLLSGGKPYSPWRPTTSAAP